MINTLWTMSLLVGGILPVRSVEFNIPSRTYLLVTVPLPPMETGQKTLYVQTEVVSSGGPRFGNSIHFSTTYSGKFNTWSLELSANYSTTTFCNHQINPKNKNNISVTVFSDSDVDAMIRILVNPVINFQLRLSQQVNTTVAPFSPKVFEFFPEQNLELGSDPDDVYLLTVKSLKNDDECMYVTINEPACPWNDNLRTVKNSKIWARMLKVGYFPIRASVFPKSFIITLVSLQNSTECFKNRKIGGLRSNGTKEVSLYIYRTLNSYTEPIVSSMAGIIVTSLVFFITWAICWKIQFQIFRECGENQISQKANSEEIIQEGTNLNGDPDVFNVGMISSSMPYIDGAAEIESKTEFQQEVQDTIDQSSPLKNNPKTRVTIKAMETGDVTVYDMSQTIREDVWHRRQRSKVYLYIVPLVAIFYLIPSAQLVWQDKEKAEESGSLEQCYLNYGCSRPWSIFTDFNHIVSNFGYIWYGFIFIILVLIKSHYLPETNRSRTGYLGTLGIPQQHSIFYTLGLSMIFQGVFSMIFHICPSNVSLQFDTTMMYIMLTLCFIKIYQFRHPDTSTNAYHFMYLISITLMLEALSLYMFTPTPKLILYSIFALLYIALMIYLAIDVYYYSAIRLSLRHMIPIFIRQALCSCSSCLFPNRLFLSISAIILNTILLLFTLIRSSGEGRKSLSTPLLMILATNMAFYLIYYTTKKFLEKKPSFGHVENETRSCLQPTMRLFSFIFFFFAILLMFVSGYFYLNKHQSRSLTPPESRDRNEECGVMDFFDNHDMWHFLSSTCLFVAFIGLLTIDDDLLCSQRNTIEVF